MATGDDATLAAYWDELMLDTDPYAPMEDDLLNLETFDALFSMIDNDIKDDSDATTVGKFEKCNSSKKSSTTNSKNSNKSRKTNGMLAVNTNSTPAVLKGSSTQVSPASMSSAEATRDSYWDDLVSDSSDPYAAMDDDILSNLETFDALFQLIEGEKDEFMGKFQKSSSKKKSLGSAASKSRSRPRSLLAGPNASTRSILHGKIHGPSKKAPAVRSHAHVMEDFRRSNYQNSSFAKSAVPVSAVSPHKTITSNSDFQHVKYSSSLLKTSSSQSSTNSSSSSSSLLSAKKKRPVGVSLLAGPVASPSPSPAVQSVSLVQSRVVKPPTKKLTVDGTHFNIHFVHDHSYTRGLVPECRMP